MFDDEADVCQCKECQMSAEKAKQQSSELRSSADHDGTPTSSATGGQYDRRVSNTPTAAEARENSAPEIGPSEPCATQSIGRASPSMRTIGIGSSYRLCALRPSWPSTARAGLDTPPVHGSVLRRIWAAVG